MQNFSVLSWNVQGRKNFTGYTFFKKIRPFLFNRSYDIIALQEMHGAGKKLKNIPALKNYRIFISGHNKSNGWQGRVFNDNVILSKHPVIRAEEIIFPRFSHKAFLENGIKADILINNRVLRLYNCHLGIFRVGMATRLKQLEYLLSDSLNHKGPTIICGDMNVATPKTGLKRKLITLWHQKPKSEMLIDGKIFKNDEREMFNSMANKYGFKEVLDLATPTWSPLKTKTWEMFKLKLDWFLIKNLGVNKVELGNYISDHRSIKADCHII